MYGINFQFGQPVIRRVVQNGTAVLKKADGFDFLHAIDDDKKSNCFAVRTTSDECLTLGISIVKVHSPGNAEGNVVSISVRH